MVRPLTILPLAALLVVTSGCEGPAARTADEHGAAASTAPDSATAHAGEHGGDGGAGDGHAAAHPASGDGQALLPIMRRLGSEMSALTHALMTDDLETVTRSAAAMAEHAPISAAEVERIHAALGPDVARFEAVDESVHVAAVRLHEAARARDPGRVVQRLGDVQRGCVSCHVQFRARLRTAAGGR